MRAESVYAVIDQDDRGSADLGRNLVVNSVGYYEFDEPFGKMHRKYGRRDYYLSYNHKGVMTVRHEGETQLVRAGGFFFFRPFEEQYYGQANNEPISSYWVHFTGRDTEAMLGELGFSETGACHVDPDDRIPALFEEMIREVSQKASNYDWVAVSLLIHICTLLSRKRAVQRSRTSQHAGERLIGESLETIHKYYNKPISIQELASSANLSISRYSKLFKEITGTAPQHYIVQFRLQKAKEFMTNMNLSLRQVAALTGFADQLYFSKMFRKYEGVTPSSFREIARRS